MNSDLIKLKEKNALLEDEINKAGENFNQFKSFYNETVCNWSERNVKSWAKKDNSTKGVNEVLAVVYRAMELTRNFKPHIIQILTVLMLVHKDPKVGRLAQVLTGEGKSWVIAILVAILKITKRCKVDIVTSSEVLAKRDAKQWETFFKLLNITSSHNIDEKEGPKDCYTHDVVYGTAHTFQADILRDEYKQAGTLNGRTSDVIIVDEVDNMLIDEHNKSTLLSDEKHGFEKLTYVFHVIWNELNSIILPKNKENINLEKYVVEKVELWLNQNEKAPKLPMPHYLKNFALKNLSLWTKNAILAKQKYKIKHHYIIKDENIVPVDFSNTGVTQTSTHWTDGLHQFLQLKHGLKLTAPTVIINYLSNVTFFKRYIKECNDSNSLVSNNIYGLTGTLGSIFEQNLLAECYGVDFIFVPTHAPRIFVEEEATLLKSDVEWVNKIKNIAENVTKEGRICLIMCETMTIAELVRNELTKSNNHLTKAFELSDIIEYTRSDIEENFLSTIISPGKIILATNLAGRGMDIKIDESVERKGGLHICVTFLPKNIRVEMQAFGRAGRQGARGSAQLVLNYYAEMEKFGFTKELISKIAEKEKNKFLKNKFQTAIDSVPKDIEGLKKNRELFEADILKSARLEISKYVLKDKLFENFKRLSQNQSFKDDKVLLNAIEEKWGLWLHELDLKQKSDDEMQQFFNRLESEILNENDLLKVIQNPKYLDSICSKALSESIMPDNRDVGFFKEKWQMAKYVAAQVKDFFDWSKDEKIFASVKEKCEMSINLD